MISRLTYWTIQSNPVEIIDTKERTECWLLKNEVPHTLLMSCKHESRPKMEEYIKNAKEELNC